MYRLLRVRQEFLFVASIATKSTALLTLFVYLFSLLPLPCQHTLLKRKFPVYITHISQLKEISEKSCKSYEIVRRDAVPQKNNCFIYFNVNYRFYY